MLLDPLAERAAQAPGRTALLDLGLGLRLTWSGRLHVTGRLLRRQL